MTNLTTFESGAYRTELPVRYDLCSKIVAKQLLAHWNLDNEEDEAFELLECLFSNDEYNLLQRLWDFIYFESPITTNDNLEEILPVNDNDAAMCYILSAYARTMHEGAAKYGERTWEKGIPENDLRNHAINHLIKYLEDDESEPHLDHLIWNVLTIIHFRELEDRNNGEK